MKLEKIANIFVKIAERCIPDPLVIAIGLTGLCFIAVLLFTPYTAIQTIDAWGASYWSLLAFTAQMILILGLGHVVAHTKPINNLLLKIATTFNSAKTAYIGLTLIASLCSLLSWGVGLIVPAILSCTIAANLKERGIVIHFPLLVCCGYSGSLVGMLGLSSTIPLLLNTTNHFLINKIGIIGLNQTIFSSWNISLIIIIMTLIPVILYRCAPERKACIEFTNQINPNEAPIDDPKNHHLSQKLENSKYLTLALGSFAGIYSLQYFIDGGALDLNSLNMIFVALGLLFSDSPKHYIILLSNAAKIAGPFLIQYPLYAGLMGMMAASGLAEIFIDGFVSISNAATLPVWTFFSAAILNIFIPSAGGQWAVQGPIMTEAALILGADISRVSMAVVIGESWTNAIQPLYMIPVLAITGLSIRDIMGYSVIVLIAMGAIYSTALILF